MPTCEMPALRPALAASFLVLGLLSAPQLRAAPPGLVEALPQAEAVPAFELPAKAKPGQLLEDFGYRLRYVPGGRYRIGSAASDPWGLPVEKEHEVELTAGFWLAETEVTQKQWMDLGLPNPSQNVGWPDYPVENVNFWDVLGFLNRLSTQAQLETCYVLNGCVGELGKPGYRCEGADLRPACRGIRLPTESEWEVAATGAKALAQNRPSVGLEAVGITPAGLDRVAWYLGNTDGRPHRVGQKQASAWGFYDLLGNVWEWTWDRYAEFPSWLVVDPEGPRSGPLRVVRGGSWANEPRFVRPSCRFRSKPDVRNGYIGFRWLIRDRPATD